MGSSVGSDEGSPASEVEVKVEVALAPPVALAVTAGTEDGEDGGGRVVGLGDETSAEHAASTISARVEARDLVEHRARRTRGTRTVSTVDTSEGVQGRGWKAEPPLSRPTSLCFQLAK